MAKDNNEVSANPTLVEWPSDPHGIASELKKALVKAAGRVNGQDDKMQVIMQTVRIGAGHLKARHAAQKETRTAEIERNRAAEVQDEQE